MSSAASDLSPNPFLSFPHPSTSAFSSTPVISSFLWSSVGRFGNPCTHTLLAPYFHPSLFVAGLFLSQHSVLFPGYRASADECVVVVSFTHLKQHRTSIMYPSV